MYACGCSGTSYNCSGMSGEMLVDRSLRGETDYDTGWISRQYFPNKPSLLQ